MQGADEGPKVIARLLLFASSYSPLLLLVGIRHDPGKGQLIWIGCAILGAAALVVVLLAARRVIARDRLFTAIDDRGGDSAGYLATYLLPFLTVGDANARDITSYVIFILIVGTIYVRSSLLSINPLVYIFGRRIVSATVADGTTILVICKAKPAQGVPVKVRSVVSGLVVLD